MIKTQDITRVTPQKIVKSKDTGGPGCRNKLKPKKRKKTHKK